jgi:hypothetical protein
MKRRSYVLLCLLLNVVGLFAQDFNDYQPLKNQGQLPTDFTLLPSVKVSLSIILAPVAIPYMVNDKYDMYYYSVLYNVKTGQNYIIKSEYFAKKDTDTLLNAHIYDALLQIKTSKEGEKEEKPIKKPVSKSKSKSKKK